MRACVILFFTQTEILTDVHSHPAKEGNKKKTVSDIK